MKGLELMKSPEISVCPNCNRKLKQIPDNKPNLVADCDCGFFASTQDMERADYLANFYRLPDVRLAARRIAGREPLMYWSAKMAS